MDLTTQEYIVTRLPDDPRLTKIATRKRQGRMGGWHTKRFTPRSVTRNHETHLLTKVY